MQNKFVNINDTFLIKKDLSKADLEKCVSFIKNYSNSQQKSLINSYKKNTFQIINLSKKIKDLSVHIIVKTKFNKDYKFININNKKIFFESNLKIKSNLSKIEIFNLNEISFFPPTFISDNIVFQSLAEGTFYMPEKLNEFKEDFLKNIASVIHNFSLTKQNELKISNFISNFKDINIKNNLNSEIILTNLKILKKYKHLKVRESLTHGDLKFDHISILNNKIEYVIDWENVGIRSIFFDLLNLFIPWFVHRSFNFIIIKNYVIRFIKRYLPNLLKDILKKYDIYFCLFALERFKRINEARSIKFDKNSANQRYNFIFKNLTKEIYREHKNI